MFLDGITPRPEATVQFFDFWFKGLPKNSLVSVVQIHPTTPKTHSYVFTIEEIRAAVESSGLDALTWARGEMFDLYFSVATLLEKPAAGKRGGLKNVKRLPGVWVDLDLKDGYFESQADILGFLGSQQLPPNAIILTGNQGAHAYWKLDKSLELEEAKKMCLKWWVYQCSLPGATRIDKLVDPSRVMRLPGSVRWPKKSDQQPSICNVMFNETSSYSKDDLEAVAESSWLEFQATAKKKQEQVGGFSTEEKREFISQHQNTDPNNPWLRMMDEAAVEENFNRDYTWDGILLHKGWTKLNTDDEGRVFWSRPGDGLRKSATTDWPESPDVMSLFSTSPETGLLALHESEIALTKYRVWIELYHDGDERSAIKSYLDDVVK